MAHELRRREWKFPSVEDRMDATINASVSHNSRGTVLEGKRQAPVHHKSWLFERINGSDRLSSLGGGGRA
jgi:hypothetical protein